MSRSLLAALAAVLFVGGGAAGFVLLRRPPLPPPSPRLKQESAHAAGIDRSMAAVRALQTAPAGATSCESAYNAFKASDDAAKHEGAKPVVLALAPRDEFLRRCAALPKEVQACLVPSWLAAHREACDKVKPSPKTLEPLVDLRRAVDPQREEPTPVVR
ncbi:MAG TPA: hypothetical protein VF997_10845 [Polyangia bacterium]